MRKRRSIQYLFASILLVLAIVPAADGKVYINIDSPSAQKFPIAITPFKNMNNAGSQESLSPWFADTLGKTLEITGFFNILDRKAFLVDQTKLGISTENIQFPAWTGIGAESLVTGGFTVSGRDLTLECRLFDVVQGKLIVGKRYTGKLEERKEMVVRFAQEILIALTGEKGLFDTKIAFAGKKGGSSEIYYVNFDGTEPVTLTNYRTITLSPKWSPDGKQISFLSYKDGAPDLHVMDLNRRTTRKILSTGRLNLPATWSADSKRMLVTSSKDGSEDIYILSISRRPDDAAHQRPGHRRLAHLVARRQADCLRLGPGRHAPDLPHGRKRRQCPEAHLRGGLQHLAGLASPFQPHRL